MRDLNRSAEIFYGSKQQYIEKQQLIREENQKTKKMIDALVPHSTVKPKDRKEIPIYSLMLATNRLNIEERVSKQYYMEHARTVSSYIDASLFLVTLPLIGVFGALDHTQKTICPHMESTCRQISTFIDEAFETASALVPGVVTKTIHSFEKNYEEFVQARVSYNENFGIPEERTRLFIKDFTKILSVCGGATALGIIGAMNASKQMTSIHSQAKTQIISNPKPPIQIGSASAPVSTPPPVDSSIFIPKKVTKEDKNIAALDNYYPAMLREQSYLARVSQALKEFKINKTSHLPQGFPSHSNQFYSSSKHLPVEGKNLGPDKKRWFRDRIRYQPIKDSKDSNSAIFLISSSKAKGELRLDGQVIKRPDSKGLDDLGKTRGILEEVFKFSEKNKYKRIFLTWDSRNTTVISNLPTTDKIRIVSVGKFPNYSAEKHLDIIEVLIHE